jgi:hypothetical protein
MVSIDLELLLATAAAFFVGSRQVPSRKLLACDAGIALIAWNIRGVLIVKYGEVILAEDYLNDITVGRATAEIFVFTLWLLVWSCFGLAVTRLLRRAANF